MKSESPQNTSNLISIQMEVYETKANMLSKYKMRKKVREL
jgi:hypothetical protein